MVSLGGFGGYVVMGLGQSIPNGEGADFALRGNAFAGSSEPGVVWVAQDTDGNGLPNGEEWHELKGSETGEAYTITYRRSGAWEGSDGSFGEVARNIYHPQDYYPAWLPDGHSWIGTRLLPATTGGGESWANGHLERGYADNFGTDYKAGETLLDISSADAELSYIDFVKVQTGILVTAGWLGELSTEVLGLRPLPRTR